MWKDASAVAAAKWILSMGGGDVRTGKKDAQIDEKFWTVYAREKSPGDWAEVIERLATTEERDKLDGLGYDVLKKQAADLLRRGEALPDFLAAFIADVLDGTFERPTEKKGPNKFRYLYRDLLIWFTVGKIAQEFDLPKYSNDHPDDKPTAAAAVAEAMDMPVETVKDVYKRVEKNRKLSSLRDDASGK